MLWVTRNGVIAVAAASGAMALTMPAHADSTADGVAAGSPGAVSGNTLQLPVHVPVNVCGNTVNVVGLLNPAAGNTCANEGGGHDKDSSGTSGGGAVAEGGTENSPGVVSGNGVQLPVDLPVNVSGNTVDVVGIGNPATGNESVNTPGEPDRPSGPKPPEPPVTPEEPTEPKSPPTADPGPDPVPHAEQPPEVSLADTGTDAALPLAAGATALVLGGAALRRRFKPGDAA
ncbi:chaplin [Streptomyces glaucescens]